MRDQDLVVVYSTFPDRESAEKTAREIVEKKLAACVNIFAGMRAIYEWEGELQADDEVAVFFKTRLSLQKELSDTLRAMHPYDTPAIFGINAQFAEENYLAWVQAQLDR